MAEKNQNLSERRLSDFFFLDEILSLPSLVGFSVESTSNLTGDKITQTQFVCLLKLKTKNTT